MYFLFLEDLVFLESLSGSYIYHITFDANRFVLSRDISEHTYRPIILIFKKILLYLGSLSNPKRFNIPVLCHYEAVHFESYNTNILALRTWNNSYTEFCNLV